MIVYSWPGKFTLVTEQRCGSSLLERISLCNDSPLIVVRDNEFDDRCVEEHITSEIPIYVLSRDLHQRRSSAIKMRLNGRNTEMVDHLNFLDGYISAYTTHNFSYSELGFYNFCLNDSHLDWGTSVYYHYLKSRGVKNLKLLWLYRPTMLESGFYLPTLTNFLGENFKNHAEIREEIYDQQATLEGKYSTNKHNEVENIVIYETYNKQFRELTDHRDDVLKFSDWIWCEQFMNNTMIDMYHGISTYDSSEVLEVVSQKLKVLNAVNIIEFYNRQAITWWPGKRLMDLRPDLFGL